MRKDMIDTYRRQIDDSIDLMIGEGTPSMEVMCSYLRVTDAISKLYVMALREALEKEKE